MDQEKGSMAKVSVMTCDTKAYAKKKMNQVCSQCKQVVDKWRQQLPDFAQDAQKTESSLCTKDNSSLGKISGGVDSSLTAYQQQSAAEGDAQATDKARSANAKKFATQLKQCESEINSTCGSGSFTSDDKSAAESMAKVCADNASASEKFAEEKKKDGIGMDDISKVMQAAAMGLGAIAPLLAQQSATGTSSAISAAPSVGTSPTPSSGASSGPSTASLGGTGSSGSFTPGSVGFSQAKPNGAAIVPSGSVTGGTGESSSPNTGGTAGATSNETQKSASAASLGSAGAGAGGLPGSSGGASSTKSGDGTAAAAAANPDGTSPFEMNLGGGLKFNGGGGGKSGKGDDAGPDAGATADAGKSPLDDIGARDPASETPAPEVAASDSFADASDSIFSQVHQRYTLIKGEGRL